jgi:putative restriction endonuclease
MNEDRLLEQLENLKRAPGRGGASGLKAPHKPLLLLIALSAIERDRAAGNRFSYLDIKGRFDELWKKYGWNSETTAKYPFWHLVSEGLWLLKDRSGIFRTRGLQIPPERRLAELNGAFSDNAWALLTQPEVRRRAIDFLVQRYFPESTHSELRMDLGLTWDPGMGTPSKVVTRKGRNPADQARFRGQVMFAYEERCAVCGFRPLNARAPSAIQAAHIWPWEHGGPYEVPNGLALCPIHHWALDAGAMAFEDDGTILVSGRVNDGPTLSTFLRAYARLKLRDPLKPDHRPHPKFLKLRRDQLFLGEAL